MRSNELILYRNFENREILDDAAFILSGDTGSGEGARNRMNSFTGSLIELAVKCGYEGNLWQAYLTHLIVNDENAYSTSCEIRGSVAGTINDVALSDFSIFREMFAIDLGELDKLCGTKNAGMLSCYKGTDTGSKAFNKRIRDRVMELRDQLCAAGTDKDFMDTATAFYKEFGVGRFGLNKAFRIVHEGDEAVIVPITNMTHIYLEDLVGYESAKRKLIDNTEAFIEGRPCNNCLLFGDAGTGKSSSVKGLLNRYYERGLRMIEIYRHQLRDLSDVISQIKDRNYRFIILMDDLSFEDYETDYKYLKAVIEGGLERKPENVLIYATSNRRHIVREKYSDRLDRDEELHSNDTVAEKLSLSYRFGVTVYFGRPDKKQYDGIVTALAKRYGIEMDEDELLLEADRWELSHGGLSGRTAQQFIDHLRGRSDK
ncbi:MAG: ATP-binding protein [Lachnospiraceae bacterium]|nr:ATP-binding protein [Lachnospiraceae bacterium]